MDIEAIFDTYYDRVYSFTLFRVRNVHDTEDITSDVFLKAAQNLERYDEKKASLPTWLLTITMNTIRDFYRTKRDSLPLEFAENAAGSNDITGGILANEQARDLYDALGQLDERQRNVVLLRYYGDMSNRQIAEILKLSVSNVETILSRARKILKNLLEQREVSHDRSYYLTKGQGKAGAK